MEMDYDGKTPDQEFAGVEFKNSPTDSRQISIIYTGGNQRISIYVIQRLYVIFL